MTRKPVTPNVWVGAFAALALLATAATVRTAGSEDAANRRRVRRHVPGDQQLAPLGRWR